MKAVAVTATTGMACMQFANSKTIHKWSGIGDGHLPRNILLQKIMRDGAMQSTKSGIQEGRCIIY